MASENSRPDRVMGWAAALSARASKKPFSRSAYAKKSPYARIAAGAA